MDAFVVVSPPPDWKWIKVCKEYDRVTVISCLLKFFEWIVEHVYPGVQLERHEIIMNFTFHQQYEHSIWRKKKRTNRQNAWSALRDSKIWQNKLRNISEEE